MFQCRCPKCNRLVGLLNGIAEIKCPRCGHVHMYNFSGEMHDENYNPSTKVRAAAEEQSLANSKA